MDWNQGGGFTNLKVPIFLNCLKPRQKDSLNSNGRKTTNSVVQVIKLGHPLICAEVCVCIKA